MNLPVQIVDTLLKPERFAQLHAIADSLNKGYRTRQIWRTETEMRVSVLNDLHFPTAAAKYWQCVREQAVYLEQLALLSFDWRKNAIRLERAQRSFKWAPWRRRELQIVIDECRFAEVNMRLAADDRIREIRLWERLKEEQKTIDPTFDTEDVNSHQLVSYTKQFILRAAHADSANLNGGEADNLIGQLRTAVRVAESSGVLNKVLTDLPRQARALVDQLELT